MLWAWSVQLSLRNSNFLKWGLHHCKAASLRGEPISLLTFDIIFTAALISLKTHAFLSEL